MDRLQRSLERVVLFPAVIIVGGVTVARLRIARPALLIVKFGILLRGQARLAMRLGEALIGPARSREIEQELLNVRARSALNRRISKPRERHEEAVVFTRPIEHPVVPGVRDEHVTSAAAEGKVAGTSGAVPVSRIVSQIIEAAIRFEVVIELEVVVPKSAEEPVLARPAEDRVIAEVAEDPILAVFDQDTVGIERFEIQQEASNLRTRIFGIVEVKLAGDRIVGERRRRDRASIVEEIRQRFRAGDCIVARTAVDEVVAEAAINDVRAAGFPSEQIDRLFEEAGNIHHRTSERTG